MLRVKKIISWATRHLLCDKYQTFKSPSIVVKINSKQLLLFPYLFQYVTMNCETAIKKKFIHHSDSVTQTWNIPVPNACAMRPSLPLRAKINILSLKCYRLKYGCYVNGKQFVRNHRSNGIQKTSVSKHLLVSFDVYTY